MRLFLPLLLAAALAAGPIAAQPAPSAQQRAVETGLLPAAVFDDQPQTFTLQQRMALWNVPGVSIAVIDDGKIAWAQGYGVLTAGDPAPVTVHTRFQAASVSKPVAALAALTLVQDGKLTLDGDVNATLKAWKLPDSPFTATRPLTLRDLLSHTGGTTVHGFPGYAQGAPVPTLVQVLAGTAPANTRPVVSEAAPGERWKYSGGGYQIVQLMMEDASGQPFADLVRARVLTPAGMADSGYALPPAGAFAFGHDGAGKPIPGGWHTYPEQAAAGLWTTPTDLARFALALTAAARGEPGAILNPDLARAMTTPVKADYGLGPGVSGEGDALVWSHGGSNEGFRVFWVIHPTSGDGVVVMTNGEGGGVLMQEVVRAVARAYGWPDFAPARHAAFPLAPEVLATREGDWSATYGGDRVTFALRRDPKGMVIETMRGTFVFTPISADTMIAADTGARATFAVGADGKPVLRVYGMELKRAE